MPRVSATPSCSACCACAHDGLSEPAVHDPPPNRSRSPPVLDVSPVPPSSGSPPRWPLHTPGGGLDWPPPRCSLGCSRRTHEDDLVVGARQPPGHIARQHIRVQAELHRAVRPQLFKAASELHRCVASMFERRLIPVRKCLSVRCYSSVYAGGQRA